MGVAYETIIQKISDELQAAMQQQDKENQFKKHIQHVRLLCDLILDGTESEQEQTRKAITEAELKAMLGNERVNKQKVKQTEFAYEDGNGDSIFDF